LDNEVTAYEIRSSYGNYRTTGAITGPGGTETNYDAFNVLVTFLRGADPAFLIQPSMLYMAPDCYNKIADACANNNPTIMLRKALIKIPKMVLVFMICNY